jgi:hypothetical protein
MTFKNRKITQVRAIVYDSPYFFRGDSNESISYTTRLNERR